MKQALAADRSDTSSATYEKPILVFDSGIGGLTVLREARVLMPDRRFVYIADDAGFPTVAGKKKRCVRALSSFLGSSLRNMIPKSQSLHAIRHRRWCLMICVALIRLYHL